MTCRIETVVGQAIRFCPEDPPVAADRVRAVLQARVLDEITNEPVEADLSVTTVLESLFPRATRGGVVGLVGQPARVFPSLDVSTVDLSLRLTAPRYLPLDLAGTLGPIAGFPICLRRSISVT